MTNQQKLQIVHFIPNNACYLGIITIERYNDYIEVKCNQDVLGSIRLSDNVEESELSFEPMVIISIYNGVKIEKKNSSE